MKADHENTHLSLEGRGSVGIGRLAGRSRARGVASADSVRRQDAIRMFFREEVDLLRSVGDDYVAVRRAGGLVLH